jgi:hypothetical protein
MNCQDFEAIVVQLACNRPLDAGRRGSGLVHAEACASCAALLADQRRLSAGLRALADGGAAEQAPERLEASLRSAFRAHAALPELAAVRRRWYAWAAFAAAGLILMIAAATRMRQTAEVPPAQPPKPPAQQSVPNTMLARTQPPVQAPARPRLVRPPRTRPAPEEEFVPLLYGAAFTPFDSGQVVRVKLPPSALVAFGLPVNANRADAVQADVLFAEDGLARAIRFVK